MILTTRLNHDLDNLCEADLSVIDTTQTPPQSFKYYTKEGAAWKSPLTGDSLTQAEAWLFDNPAHVSTPDPDCTCGTPGVCHCDYCKVGTDLSHQGA